MEVNEGRLSTATAPAPGLPAVVQSAEAAVEAAAPGEIAEAIHRTGILEVDPGSVPSNPAAATALVGRQAQIASQLTGKLTDGTVSKTAGSASNAFKSVADKAGQLYRGKLKRGLEHGRTGMGLLGGTASVFAGVEHLRRGDEAGALEIASGTGKLIETGIQAMPRRLSEVATRLAPTARVAGGVALGADGVRDIYQGVGDGDVTRVAGGVVKTGTGALTVAGGTATKVLTRFGGAASGVVFMIDGGMDVADGITSDDHRQAAAGLVKMVGGGMMTAGIFCGPAGPVVAGIGTGVYYVGVGIENWDAIESVASDVADGAVQVGRAVGQGVANAAEAVGDGARSAGQVLKDGWNWVFGSS